jgi:hypothetical protein
VTVTLEQLVQDSSAEWTRALPADERTIEQLQAALPSLPAEYLAFLRLSNGGEGALGVEPGWFQLWPAAEVPSLNRGYAVSEFLPTYVGFGSDGGGELLAFAPTGEIVRVPFVPMATTEVRVIAPSFRQLAAHFGHRAPAL